MDPIPFVIVFVSVSLTITLVILSIQIWNILKEFRVTVQKINGMLDQSNISIQKVNKMLEDAGKVSGTVSEGVTQVSGFMNGIKSGLNLITTLTHKGGPDGSRES
jgi:uncharacterized protein YoxC